MICPKCGSKMWAAGLRYYRRRWQCSACNNWETGEYVGAKILHLDIETAPIEMLSWGMWNQNHHIDQIVHDWHILCWAAKWHHKSEVIASALPGHKNYKDDKRDDSAVCGAMWNLLDDADIVVAHNGDKFDIKKINARFLLHGFPPPSPYKQIDTLKMARRKFAITSNKLDYLGRYLGIGRKVKHEGFDLWIKCMAGDMAAWAKMIRYNKQDVRLLEKVYKILAPWETNLPNGATYVDDETRMCTVPGCGGKCGLNGYRNLNFGRYQKYVCTKCGHPQRGRTNLLTKEKREKINANIL